MNFYFLKALDGSWANPNNWSDSDGGMSIGSVPTATDDVFFTALSGNCTQDSGIGLGITIRSLTCIGYNGTLSLDYPTGGSLTVNGGDIILSSGMKIYGKSNPSGSAIGITASCSITTNGVAIPHITTNNSNTTNITITLLDTLNVVGTLTQRNVIWAGNYGFIANNFINNDISGVTTILVANNTYIVKGKLSSTLTRGNLHGIVKSSLAGTKAKLTCTGDTNIGYVDFTDIDASGGVTLYPFNGVVTNCINIVSLTDRILPVNTTVASSRIS